MEEGSMKKKKKDLENGRNWSTNLENGNNKDTNSTWICSSTLDYWHEFQNLEMLVC